MTKEERAALEVKAASGTLTLDDMHQIIAALRADRYTALRAAKPKHQPKVAKEPKAPKEKKPKKVKVVKEQLDMFGGPNGSQNN